MKPNYRDIALEFIRRNPGATGAQIWMELQRNSRSARWFGPDSFWTALLGPSSGTTYVILAQLETDGIIRSHWGEPTLERRGRRPRHYYLKAKYQ